jgi:NADH dehydrogenase FAD-containing subunit
MHHTHTRPHTPTHTQITLVDQGERFTFKPLLYELLNGTAQPWEVAPTFAQLLAPYPIQFVQVGREQVAT